MHQQMKNSAKCLDFSIGRILLICLFMLFEAIMTHTSIGLTNYCLQWNRVNGCFPRSIIQKWSLLVQTEKSWGYYLLTQCSCFVRTLRLNSFKVFHCKTQSWFIWGKPNVEINNGFNGATLSMIGLFRQWKNGTTTQISFGKLLSNTTQCGHFIIQNLILLP